MERVIILSIVKTRFYCNRFGEISREQYLADISAGAHAKLDAGQVNAKLFLNEEGFGIGEEACRLAFLSFSKIRQKIIRCDRVLRAQVDGEVLESDTFDFKVLPAKFDFIKPH